MNELYVMNKQKFIRHSTPAILLTLYSGLANAMPASGIILRRHLPANSAGRPTMILFYSILTLIAGIAFVIFGIRWMRKSKKEKNEKDPENELWKIDYNLSIGVTVTGSVFIVLSLFFISYYNF